MIMTRKAEWVSLLGKVEISIKEATRTMNGMVTVKCTGLMAPVIRVNGKMEFSMELVVWSFLMGE